jgi:hypothetical protein
MAILARGFVFNEKGDFVAQTVSLRPQAEPLAYKLFHAVTV